MAAEKKPAATPTEYVLLRRTLGHPAEPVGDADWAIVAAKVMATSANGAIRQVAAKLNADAQAGTFVAVPARSWHPVTVQPQTTLRLELTEAKA